MHLLLNRIGRKYCVDDDGCLDQSLAVTVFRVTS
jgi:hypothetical protein